MDLNEFLLCLSIQECCGLLYLHNFNSLKFNSTLEQSTEMFIELCLDTEHELCNIDLPSMIFHDHDDNDDLLTEFIESVLDYTEDRSAFSEPPHPLFVGEQFIQENFPGLYESIDRELSKDRDKEELINFYKSDGQTDISEGNLFLPDDLASLY